MQLKRHLILCLIIIPIALFTVNNATAKVQDIDPEVLDYHLKLAKGVLDTCYARDQDTGNLIPNPALDLLSKLASTCDKKMQSLDNFLAKFVGDKDGNLYRKHLSNDSKS
jgi:hypothetical protein